MSDLYNHIEELGKKNGYKNITDFCRHAGVTRGILTDLKMGRTKNLSPENAQKFADLLKVSLDEVYGREAKEKPAAKDGNGLTPEQEELVKLFDSASPALQDAALAVLRSASNLDKARGDE